MSILPFRKDDRQAIIFIGIQASGKTTFYKKEMYDGGYIHISLDILHTRNREAEKLEKCVRSNKSFVIDNTNPTKSDRTKYIQLAKQHGYHIIGLFFQSKVKDCIKRNEQRDGNIPSKAIAATSNKLEMPSKSEGFDELYSVKICNNDFEITKWEG